MKKMKIKTDLPLVYPQDVKKERGKLLSSCEDVNIFCTFWRKRQAVKKYRKICLQSGFVVLICMRWTTGSGNVGLPICVKKAPKPLLLNANKN